MPTKILPIPPTLSPGIMDDFGIAAVANRETELLQSGADVYVFIVKEIAFIEPSDPLKGFAAEQHKHSCYPVGKT